MTEYHDEIDGMLAGEFDGAETKAGADDEDDPGEDLATGETRESLEAATAAFVGGKS